MDHARLAGTFASHWGNAKFTRPEPFAAILDGISRHDDAWAAPDASPNLTPAGEPAGFSKDLVGSYSAFENIDLAAYLEVRGAATEAVAADHPYAAVLVSMHTVNLLTEQADLSSLSENDRELHGRFVERQRERQQELIELANRDARLAPFTAAGTLNVAFRLLQACDSLSLVVCSRYPSPIKLRHAHPTTSGTDETILCTPLGNDRYKLAPYPFDMPSLTVEVPYREIKQTGEPCLEAFRSAYGNAKDSSFPVTLTA
ncbi:DUF3891 family protein [Akkermansiaceae bacterium]|nr:DUF3891 family protein [Akkermansiaceae bacterium]